MFLSKIQLQNNTDDIILWLLKIMCVCLHGNYIQETQGDWRHKWGKL